MARPKKRTTKRNPTNKKAVNPREVGESGQEDPVEKGIVATPDSTPLQVQTQNDDRTRDTFPTRRVSASTSQRTSQQPPARKNAARATRTNKATIVPNSGDFEAGQPIANEVSAASAAAARSKVVTLRVTPHKLQRVLELYTAEQKKQTLAPSREEVRRLDQEPVVGEPFSPSILRPGVPVVEEAAGMAPVKEQIPHDILDDRFKEVIQNLYDMASITHGYLTESHNPLVDKTLEFTRSLAELSDLTADNSTHPAAQTIKSTLIPPEVIDYVFAGRNPDIYTREFVENVNRGNHVLNGKMDAFGSMAEIYARETKSAMPELSADMDRIIEHYGGFERDAKTGDWKWIKSEVGAEVEVDMDRLMKHNGGFEKDPKTGEWKMRKPEQGSTWKS